MTERRGRTRALALFPAVCACLIFAGLAPASPPSGNGVLISHLGTWKFSRLGVPKIVVKPGKAAFRYVVVKKAFQLPKGAKQGPGKWYLVRLHYEVDIARDTGTGTVDFSADTNGGYSAQILFDVRRSPSGTVTVTSDSLGLVSGHVVRSGHKLVWRGWFENFMPYAGVRAGLNTFGVTVQHSGNDQQVDDARAARVVVFPDSAIIYAQGSPTQLALRVLPPPSAQVGQRVRIQVTVKNNGGRRSMRGHVSLTVPSHVAVLGPSSIKLPPLNGGKSRTVSFYVRPDTTGAFHLVADAAAGLSHPETDASLRVH